MCNGLALGDAQSGRTVTIRPMRCSILCLRKARVRDCLAAVKIVSIATRSTVRAHMYDELAFGTACLNCTLETRMQQEAHMLSHEISDGLRVVVVSAQ